MGNTSTNSLDHSFKRLRLSQTEHLRLSSPTCTSPKRKTAVAITTDLDGTFGYNTTNDANDQLPILICHNNISSSTLSNSLSQTLLPITNDKLVDTDFLSDDELIGFVKTYTKAMIFNDKSVATNGTSSDETMTVYLPYTKVIPELSDNEVMECVRYGFIDAEYK